MYHVIIVLDKIRGKSYYHSYIENDGNIECEELPPYQDIQKARACYWDMKSQKWVYDEEKYTELVDIHKAAKAAEEQAKKEAEAIASNKELTDAVLELAVGQAEINAKITKLSTLLKGGEA